MKVIKEWSRIVKRKTLSQGEHINIVAISIFLIFL